METSELHCIHTYTHTHVYICLYFHDSTALVRQVLLVGDVSKSHADTPHSVWLLWTNDRPVAETFTWQHSQETGIHAYGKIRSHNPSNRAVADSLLRPRDHRIVNGVYRHLRTGCL